MTAKLIYLTPQQFDILTKMAKDTGLSSSELIRRAVDEYLGRRAGSGKYQYNLPVNIIQEKENDSNTA